MWFVTIAFYITFAITVFGVIYAIRYSRSNRSQGHIVYAGKLKAKQDKTFAVCLSGTHFVKDGVEIDPSKLTFFKVSGNSMSTRGINSGDGLFVEPVPSEAVRDMQPHVKIVLRDSTPEGNGAFKLRNFLVYVPAGGKESAINRVKELVKADKNFPSDDINKLASVSMDSQKEYILSSTYLEKEHRKHISLHPLTQVYGRVRYAIPATECAKLMCR